MRGNEYQQLYICSQLVKRLGEMEEQGRLTPGKQIMVIPCVNPYSMNVQKRFWSIDNTDINRMFPGYSLGRPPNASLPGSLKLFRIFLWGCSFLPSICRARLCPMCA